MTNITKGVPAPHDRQQVDYRPLLVGLFQAWRRNNIDFLILRNYDNVPDAVSNDLDVLIDTDLLATGEHTLVAEARAHGYKLTNHAEFFWVKDRPIKFSVPQFGSEVAIIC